MRATVSSTPAGTVSELIFAPAGNPFHQLGYIISLIYLYMVFVRVPELSTRLFGSGLRMAAVLSCFVLATAFLTGAFARAFVARSGVCLILFTFWLLAATPLSYWRGGSVNTVIGFLKSMLAFLVIAGTMTTLGQCRRGIQVIGWSALTIAVLSLVFGRVNDGRFELAYGTLQNSNDLASYLLIGLPFCIYIVLDPESSMLRRSLFGFASLFIAFTAVKTGSRGGLITFGVLLVLIFWRASLYLKIWIAAAAVVLGLVGYQALPEGSRDRYRVLFATNLAKDPTDSSFAASALDSSTARLQHLQQSIEMTFRHPFFGVGPGQFAPASAEVSERRGEMAQWKETHNTLTQISSEAGLPALVFYLTALVMCVMDLWGIRAAAKRLEAVDWLLANRVRSMALTLLWALVAYFVSAQFASVAYNFHFPMIAGFITAIASAVRDEVRRLPVAEAADPWSGVRAPRPDFTKRIA